MGDSQGPLMIISAGDRYVQVGIISRGNCILNLLLKLENFMCFIHTIHLCQGKVCSIHTVARPRVFTMMFKVR